MQLLLNLELRKSSFGLSLNPKNAIHFVTCNFLKTQSSFYYRPIFSPALSWWLLIMFYWNKQTRPNSQLNRGVQIQIIMHSNFCRIIICKPAYKTFSLVLFRICLSLYFKRVFFKYENKKKFKSQFVIKPNFVFVVISSRVYNKKQ